MDSDQTKESDQGSTEIEAEPLNPSLVSVSSEVQLESSPSLLSQEFIGMNHRMTDTRETNGHPILIDRISGYSDCHQRVKVKGSPTQKHEKEQTFEPDNSMVDENNSFDGQKSRSKSLKKGAFKYEFRVLLRDKYLNNYNNNNGFGGYDVTEAATNERDEMGRQKWRNRILKELCKKEKLQGDLYFFTNGVLVSSKILPGIDHDWRDFLWDSEGYNFFVSIKMIDQVTLHDNTEESIVMMQDRYLLPLVPFLIHSYDCNNEHESNNTNLEKTVPPIVLRRSRLTESNDASDQVFNLQGVTFHDGHNTFVVDSFTTTPFKDCKRTKDDGSEETGAEYFERIHYYYPERPDLPGIVDRESRNPYPAELLRLMTDPICDLVVLGSRRHYRLLRSHKLQRDRTHPLLGQSFKTIEEFSSRAVTFYSNAEEGWNALLDQRIFDALSIRSEARWWRAGVKGRIHPVSSYGVFPKKEQSERLYTTVPLLATAEWHVLYSVDSKDRKRGVIRLKAVDPLVYYGMEDLRYLEMDESVMDIYSESIGLDLDHVAIGDQLWIHGIAPLEPFTRHAETPPVDVRVIFKVARCTFIEPNPSFERMVHINGDELIVAGEARGERIRVPAEFEGLQGVFTATYRVQRKGYSFLSAVPASDAARDTLFEYMMKDQREEDDKEEIQIMSLKSVDGPRRDIMQARAEDGPMVPIALKDLSKLVQLATTGCIRKGRDELDMQLKEVMLTDLNLSGKRGKKKIYLYETTLRDREKENGWSTGEHLTVAWEEEVRGQKDSFSCRGEILRAKFLRVGEETGLNLILALRENIVVRSKVTLTLKDPYINPAQQSVLGGIMFSERSNGGALLKTIYDGRKLIQMNEEIKKEVLSKTISIYSSTGEVWDPEQKIFIILASSLRIQVLLLDSGPGCGKTLAIAAAIRQTLHLHEGAIVLVVAQTNTGVGVVTQKIEDLPSLHTTVLRVTHKIGGESETASLSKAIIRVQKNRSKDRTSDLEEAINFMNKLREETPDPALRTAAQVLELSKAEYAVKRIMERDVSIVLEKEKPNVLSMTIDRLLKEMEGFWREKKDEEVKEKGKGRGKKPITVAKYIRSFSNVFLYVDEASIVPESSLLALTEALPNAVQRWAGDPRQLQPFSRSTESSFDRDFGSFGVAKVLEQSQCTRVTLRTCRRMVEGIGNIASELFYNDELKCIADPLPRSIPTLFTGRAPVAFFELSQGGDEVMATNSRINEQELKTVEKIIHKYSHQMNPFSSSSLRVICCYKDQAEKLQKRYPLMTVATVDSSQGAEADVVILLTTNSTGEPGFVSDPFRLNVALTRAKRGLIILGCRKTLKRHEYWKTIVKYCKENGRMVAVGGV